MRTHGSGAPGASAYSLGDRLRAVGWGAACHAVFAAAILAMIAGLHEGMRFGVGTLEGAAGWLANGALALSFPSIHSWLLTARGGKLLDRVATGSLGRDLRTTSYALVASLQLLTVFALWSPTGEVLWRAEGAGRAASEMLFAASWLLLGKAMWDAGLGVQTGFLGWGSVARGRAPQFRSFPAEGLFRFTRQPVYVAFTMTLWTGPVLTTDRLFLAAAWTLYCIGGPRLKERRMLARDPEGYRRYQALVPYWLPRWKPEELEP